VTTWIIGMIIFLVIGGGMGYLIGVKIYVNKEMEDTLVAFLEFIKKRKA